MKSKIISVLLILSAVLGAAGEAVAKDPPPIGSTYEYGGLTYYNANSQNFNSDKRFFVDLISAKHSSLGGHSIADLWLMTGVGLALQLGYWSDILTAVAKEGILNGSIGDDKRYIYSFHTKPLNGKAVAMCQQKQPRNTTLATVLELRYISITFL